MTSPGRALPQARVRASISPQREVLRALIVLAVDAGMILPRSPVISVSASTWSANGNAAQRRRRGRATGSASFGTPTNVHPVEVAEVKALACSTPADHRLPSTRWSVHELPAQATGTGLVRTVSPATVRQRLDADEKSQLQALHATRGTWCWFDPDRFSRLWVGDDLTTDAAGVVVAPAGTRRRWCPRVVLQVLTEPDRGPSSG